MIRQEAKQAERKVKPNRHVLCINIGICIGNDIESGVITNKWYQSKAACLP